MSNEQKTNTLILDDEVIDALNTLRNHGLKINLPDDIKKIMDNSTLFDGDDKLFKKLIKDANVYFEYGCGKSTNYVLNFSKAKIFSVDTSELWLKRVNSNSDNPRLNLKWVDVGNIGNWGYPTSFRMRKNFPIYANWFWNKDEKPDLVLIDGRFRIFCFLTSILHANVGTKILFDDYINRPFYHVVEEFCSIVDTCGRQALFEVTAKSKDQVNEEVLSSFKNVIS